MSKLTNFLNNPVTKKVVSGLGVAVAGGVAVLNAISDQKKEAEYNEMKEFYKELKSQKEQ